MDIQAGVAMLRRRPFVNGQRIAVVGIGSGATAALLAAREDPSIAALVLDHPIRDANAVVAERFVPREPMIEWMQPLCKWMFELAYQVDVDEVDLSRLGNVMHSRPVLMLDTPTREISSGALVIAVRDFLRATLQKQPRSTASAR